jgi:hypothetical protein
MAEHSVMCPSARCEPGALLLGIILPSGRVAFTTDEIRVDDEFVALCREGRAPEKRFRFSSACARGACRQWTGSSCGVIESLLPIAEPAEASSVLPTCVIRPRCRWYLQAGADACAVCPEVVTDNRPTGEPGGES